VLPIYVIGRATKFIIQKEVPVMIMTMRRLESNRKCVVSMQCVPLLLILLIFIKRIFQNCDIYYAIIEENKML